MPYILPHQRDGLDPTKADSLVGNSEPVQSAGNAGQLNFQITRLVDRFVNEQGGNYEAINAAVGALECAKLELYRRIAAPYEDTKAKQNGDVYT